ncbi:hypothetical protein K438DRAFT_1774969 [Mycena galopus ATCC 62051]|nr:hypothetical protein K438DRAFT_1774969 [Mycena galopus ATCC 62051]
MSWSRRAHNNLSIAWEPQSRLFEVHYLLAQDLKLHISSALQLQRHFPRPSPPRQLTRALNIFNQVRHIARTVSNYALGRREKWLSSWFMYLNFSARNRIHVEAGTDPRILFKRPPTVLTCRVVGLFWASLKLAGLFHPEIILRPNSYLTSHVGHISCVLYAASTYSTFMADIVIPYFAVQRTDMSIPLNLAVRDSFPPDIGARAFRAYGLELYLDFRPAIYRRGSLS